MLVRLDGAKEYVLCCIGVIGEIEEEWIKGKLQASYSPRFVKNLINDMLSAKLIKRTKEKCFRLKKPNGLDWLKKKSPELYRNYLLATNNHDFAGSERRIKRRMANTKILEHLIDQKIPINFYELDLKSAVGRKNSKAESNNIMDMIGISRDAVKEYRSIFNSSNQQIKSLDEQLIYIEPEDVFFLTGKIIRKEEHSSEKQTTARKSSSRMHGILAGNQNFYPAYYVGTGTEWSPKIENQTNIILRNSWWKKWGKREDYLNNLKGDAIFYYDSPSVMNEYVNKIEQNRPKGIRPWDVYDKVFMIPLSDKYIEKIILEYKYEDKLHNTLFGESVAKDTTFYDALINDQPVWELLTNDIVKIKKIKSIEKTIKEAGHSLTLVSYEWQKEYLKSLFEDSKVLTLNYEEVKKIINAIQERR